VALLYQRAECISRYWIDRHSNPRTVWACAPGKQPCHIPEDISLVKSRWLRRIAKIGEERRRSTDAGIAPERRLGYMERNEFAPKQPTWWARLSAQIMQANPNLQLPATMPPQVRFWQRVASPKEYEASSRERMRRSPDPIISARSRATGPVEGNSEIDLIIESPSLLIYIEAKLDSDISMRTTYDPARNQIIRNIDCLLNSARGPTPLFWMFVRDASQGRAYTQLMRKYREEPTTLSHDLPHRDPMLLEKVAQSLTLVTWREIAQEICAPCATDDEQLLSIKRELWRRVQ
jgi:hypothetical protein